MLTLSTLPPDILYLLLSTVASTSTLPAFVRFATSTRSLYQVYNEFKSLLLPLPAQHAAGPFLAAFATSYLLATKRSVIERDLTKEEVREYLDRGKELVESEAAIGRDKELIRSLLRAARVNDFVVPRVRGLFIKYSTSENGGDEREGAEFDTEPYELQIECIATLAVFYSLTLARIAPEDSEANQESRRLDLMDEHRLDVLEMIYGEFTEACGLGDKGKHQKVLEGWDIRGGSVVPLIVELWKGGFR